MCRGQMLWRQTLLQSANFSCGPFRWLAITRTDHGIIPASAHQWTCRNSPSCVPLIGLEVHAQLATQSKLFSRSAYTFGSMPNSQLDLLDVAMPGSMPLLNRRSVVHAMFMAFALGSRINPVSYFDRKHYFYADSPAGYQITQYRQPIAVGGHLDYLWPIPDDAPNPEQLIATQAVKNDIGHTFYLSRARIRRLQIEQDTGKSIHDVHHGRSLIDLNRSGVGLVELVTEPDFNHPSQAAAFVNELAILLSFLGCCNANASLGELRVDVNVSVGPSLTEQGPRTEVKNVNSIRAVSHAIAFEIDRQMQTVRDGGALVNETRSYDPVRDCTLSMRDKEVIQDYRYLPEPNLPPLRLRLHCPVCLDEATTYSHGSTVDTDRLCITCTERQYTKLVEVHGGGMLPNQSRHQLLAECFVPWDRASVLAENPSLKTLFDTCLQRMLQQNTGLNVNSKADISRELSYWITGQLYGMLKRGGLPQLPDPSLLIEFVQLSLSGAIHGVNAEKLLSMLTSEPPLEKSTSCLQLATSRGWILINDPHQMVCNCSRVLNDHKKLVRILLNA
ncbi:Glutamyl-tRNA(Gln) amidotransferase subunit B mitochondrial [Paragonimus heterotremus]|uniref:Glutamyl-tRNA(Gln) amidotransferase subunit B mitochondrial n=1 Tax=Paragonimus heterotremus TaxID=100268 RepID=A0A8J4SMN1_9TREM|nr:Glutamyl-tRNA(Gln) amidotransferase subunit B mitochondrial [Paragonimus heterotremus]